MNSSNRRTTMKDVAHSVGVSVTTVSHALNRTRHVEESTRNSIFQAVKELGYEPNFLARSLKGKGSRTIGVIISDISESFFSDIIKSIEKTANEKGYNIILCDSDGSLQKEEHYFNLLFQRGADGLIIAPVDQFREPYQPGLTDKPIVQIDRKIRRSKGNFIGIDNAGSALKATRLLMDNGCRKIGFIGYGDDFFTMAERYRGYASALRENSLDPLVYRSGHRAESVEDVAKWLREQKPDGVLCTNENLSYCTCLAAGKTGMDIPGDLKLIGYDDARWLTLLKSPLTVIRQPTEKIGISAINAVIDMIDGGMEVSQDLLLPWELVIRGSCGSRLERKE